MNATSDGCTPRACMSGAVTVLVCSRWALGTLPPLAGQSSLPGQHLMCAWAGRWIQEKYLHTQSKRKSQKGGPGMQGVTIERGASTGASQGLLSYGPIPPATDPAMLSYMSWSALAHSASAIQCYPCQQRGFVLRLPSVA